MHYMNILVKVELRCVTFGVHRKRTGIYQLQKNHDTILRHNENFCRPTHLVLQHQDNIKYYQSANDTPTATSPATKQLLGLVW